MAGKLDQSLEDIVKDQKKSSRGPVAGKRRVIRRKTVTGPSGGINKDTRTVKNAKAATKNGETTVPAAKGESKITVYGLPADVSEQQIQDYFSKTIGPVKKAFLVYGPTGQSRGISTIVFQRSGSAVEAAKQLNGVKVDNRVMRIEVNVTADQAPTPASLGDRIAGQRNKAKGTKGTTANEKGPDGRKAVGRKGQRPGRKTNRPKPKTTVELDEEMTDYFGDASGAAASTNGAGQATANGGQAAMEEEIM